MGALARRARSAIITQGWYGENSDSLCIPAGRRKSRPVQVVTGKAGCTTQCRAGGKCSATESSACAARPSQAQTSITHIPCGSMKILPLCIPLSKRAQNRLARRNQLPSQRCPDWRVPFVRRPVRAFLYRILPVWRAMAIMSAAPIRRTGKDTFGPLLLCWCRLKGLTGREEKQFR